ncbi:NAD synthetase [Pseudomonas sp. DTU_2021_1001937_2_SI_NGA_ILE_001]|uniref:NAD synthetase n=1 Tax=Pseudomonas sp. DTU_2021_1001937_2_SI_NGA_ILE_001 TaxID=3077589 RepID=UPI0028FC0BC8|nr:NAD synthetase [Pseudomonas sp. DTU_2021_1001937_2_SI_NGA_ILE_001]WNW13137.1 NAD synthetase [Pseudomonas sp. DTU_2021_1001937_2_SI_NGA_ILE_001]
MHSVLLKDGFSVAKTNARLRIESTLDLLRLFRIIDSDPAIVGAGVIYIDSELNIVTLRDFQALCSVAVKHVVLRESPRYMAPQEFARTLEVNPRESQIAFEVFGMTLSCAGAVIAWQVIGAGGAGLVPFTAGASTVVAYVGYAAAAATAMQCVNGIARVSMEIFNPDLKDWLDSNDWYQEVSIILDAISLLGVAVTAMATVKLVVVIRSSTGKSLLEALKGLTRQERAKLTQELLRIQDPRLTTKLLKLKRLAGELPRRVSALQLRRDILNQISDLFGAGLALTGSSTAGSLRALAIGVYSEVTDE